MKIQNATASVSFNQLVDCINENLSNTQKVILAKKMSQYGDLIDMSYIEDLLVMAAKIRLKSIKKNRVLYNKNRAYFTSLKTITKLRPE